MEKATDKEEVYGFACEDSAEGQSTNGQNVATCEHCGYTGLDVEMTVQHVGGKDDAMIALCQNRVAWWRRWDALHRMISCPKCHSILIERSEDGPQSC